MHSQKGQTRGVNIVRHRFKRSALERQWPLLRDFKGKTYPVRDKQELNAFRPGASATLFIATRMAITNRSLFRSLFEFMQDNRKTFGKMHKVHVRSKNGQVVFNDYSADQEICVRSLNPLRTA